MTECMSKPETSRMLWTDTADLAPFTIPMRAAMDITMRIRTIWNIRCLIPLPIAPQHRIAQEGISHLMTIPRGKNGTSLSVISAIRWKPLYCFMTKRETCSTAAMTT